MSMYKFSCGCVFSSLDYEPRNGIAESYGKSMLSFSEAGKIVLQSGTTSYIPTSSVSIPN